MRPHAPSSALLETCLRTGRERLDLRRASAVLHETVCEPLLGGHAQVGTLGLFGGGEAGEAHAKEAPVDPEEQRRREEQNLRRGRMQVCASALLLAHRLTLTQGVSLRTGHTRSSHALVSTT